MNAEGCHRQGGLGQWVAGHETLLELDQVCSAPTHSKLQVVKRPHDRDILDEIEQRLEDVKTHSISSQLQNTHCWSSCFSLSPPTNTDLNIGQVQYLFPPCSFVCPNRHYGCKTLKRVIMCFSCFR